MSKRFYKQAAAKALGDGFAVELDGRAVKTPAGRPLTLPTLALAQAVAAEWNAQGDKIEPKSMHLMPLCGTAIDRVPEVRAGLIEGLLRYADTDLLCYRAAHPEDLARRQAEAWQPLLDWAADALGARLVPTQGVSHVPQDPAAHDAFQAALEGCDDWTLTALGELVGITGSLVVGLAVVKGRLTAREADAAAHVDDDYQQELWGEDAEAAKRRAGVRRDLETAARFLELLKA